MRDPLASKAPAYTGGTLTSAYARRPTTYSGGIPAPAPRPQTITQPRIERMRPAEDFTRGGLAAKRWDAIDEWVATSKQVRDYDEGMAQNGGKGVGRSYLAGDYMDRLRVRETELFDQVTSRENLSPTHPAVVSLVRDAKAAGVTLSAADVARTSRVVDLDMAMKAVMSRTRMNPDGTMVVDQRGVTNILLSLQQSNPTLAGMLPAYMDAAIAEQVGNAAGVAAQAAQDENIVSKGLEWAGANVAIPAMNILSAPSEWANQAIRGTYYGLRQSENPADFVAKYVQSITNPTGMIVKNWSDVERGDWDEEGLASLRAEVGEGRVNAALEMSRAIGEGDPDRIFTMMTESNDPEVERFLEGIIYSAEDGLAIDESSAELLRKVEEMNLGSTGATVLTTVLGDTGSGNRFRSWGSDVTTLGAAFVDPLVVLGPAYRAMLLARYSITKLGPGMGAGYRAALSSKKVAGVETNRVRSYFEGVLREVDRTEDALARSRTRGSSQGRRVSRQHRELPDDLIDWIAKTVPRVDGNRQMDDLIDAFEIADNEFVMKGGSVVTRAQQIASSRLARRLVEREIIDRIDEVVIDPQTLTVTPRQPASAAGGIPGTQGSLLTPAAQPLHIDQELLDEVLSLRNRVMGRDMAGEAEHFSSRITSRANQRDMLLPRRGALASLRIRSVNSIMLNERIAKTRRMDALEEKYLADVENADDIQQVFDENFETIGGDDRRIFAGGGSGRFNNGALPGRFGAGTDELTRMFGTLPNQSYIYLKDSRDADTFYKMARSMFSQRTAEYLTQAFKEAGVGTRRLMVASVIRSGAAARGVNLTKEEVLGRLDDLATGTRRGEMYAIPTADRPSVLAVQATMRQAESVARKRNKDLRRADRSEGELTRLQAQLDKELEPLGKLEGALVDTGKVAKLRKKVSAKETQMIRQRARVTAHDKKLEQFKQRLLRHMSDGQKQKPSRTRANIDTGGANDALTPTGWWSFPSAWNGDQVSPIVERVVDDIEDFLPQAGWWNNIPPAPKGPVRQGVAVDPVLTPQGTDDWALPAPVETPPGQQVLADDGTLVTEAGTAPTSTGVGRAERPGVQSSQQLGFDAEGMTPPPTRMVGANMQELSFGEDVVRELRIKQDGPGRWVVKDGNTPVQTYPTYEAARQHPGIDLESWSGAELDRLDNEAWDTATVADDGTVSVTAPSTYYSSDSGKTLTHTIRPDGDNVVVRTENEAGQWVEIAYAPEMGKARVPYQPPESYPTWVQVGDVNVSSKMPNKVKDALRGNARRTLDEAEERGFVTPATGRTVDNANDPMDLFDALDEAEQDRIIDRIAKARPDLVENGSIYEVPIGTGKDIRQTWMTKESDEVDNLIIAEMAKPDDRLLTRDMSDDQIAQEVQRISVVADRLTGDAAHAFGRAQRAIDDGDFGLARRMISQTTYRAKRQGMDLDTPQRPDSIPESPFTLDEPIVDGVIYRGYQDGKLALEVDPTIIDEDDAFALMETMIEVERRNIPQELRPAYGRIMEDTGVGEFGAWVLSRSPAGPGKPVTWSFKSQGGEDNPNPGLFDLSWTEDGQMTGMSTPRERGKVGIDREAMAEILPFIDELAVTHDFTAPYAKLANDAVNNFREEMGLPPARISPTTFADRLAAKGAEKPQWVEARKTEKVTESKLTESWNDDTITVRRFDYPSGEVRYEATIGQGDMVGRMTWNDRGGVATSGFAPAIDDIGDWTRYAAARGGLDMVPPGRVSTVGGITPVQQAARAIGSLDEWLLTYEDTDWQDLLNFLNDMRETGSTLDDTARRMVDEITEDATAAYARRAMDDPSIRDGYLESLGYGGDTPPAGAVERFGKMFDERVDSDLQGEGFFQGAVSPVEADSPPPPPGKDGVVKYRDQNQEAWWEHGALSPSRFMDQFDEFDRFGYGEESMWAWWNTGDPEAYSDPRFFEKYGAAPKMLPDPGTGLPAVRRAARIPGEYKGANIGDPFAKDAHELARKEVRLAGVALAKARASGIDADIKKALARAKRADEHLATGGKKLASKRSFLRPPWKRTTTDRDDFIMKHWLEEAEAAAEEVVQGNDFGPLLTYLDDVRLQAAAREGRPITTDGRIVPVQDELVPTPSGPRPVTDDINAMDDDELEIVLARIAEDRPELVDGDDPAIEMYLDEDTGEMRFDLLDENNLDFQRAFLDATVGPETPQIDGVGSVPADAPQAVPMPTTEPVPLDQSLAGMLGGDFPGASKRLKASIKRTVKFGPGTRIAVSRPRQHANASASGDYVPGEVLLLDDDSPAYLYHTADPANLHPVDPQDHTKGFVWIPESYEDEVSAALARESQNLEQYRRHLNGKPEDGWQSLHDDYVDRGTLDLLRALDDAGVTGDDIKKMYDKREKAAFDKSYGGRAMPVRSQMPAGWAQAVRNIIDRDLADDLVGFTADDLAAAREALTAGRSYDPPVGYGLNWTGNRNQTEFTEKVTGIKVKNRGGQQKEGTTTPLSPDDVEPDDWYVVDASGAEIMSGFRSKSAAKKAVQAQLRPRRTATPTETAPVLDVAPNAPTVSAAPDSPIPVDEPINEVPEEVVPDPAGQPPTPPPTGGGGGGTPGGPPPGATPPPGAGDWRPDPMSTNQLTAQEEAVGRWIDENGAGGEWSPSRGLDGRESALHVYQTSDYVGIPSLTDIEAIRRFRSGPFGDILGKSAQTTTDLWSLGTLYGFRFAQRSAIEDLMVYTMTGGLGRLGDLRRGRSMSQAVREGKPSMKPETDDVTGETVMLTQNDKVKLSRLGLVKKRTKAVASTRAGRAVDRGAVAATSAIGRWIHLKNLEAVQTWLSPYAPAEETMRAAAHASRGNMIPMRRLVVQIAGRMKLSGLKDHHLGYLGDLAESHTGIKMMEQIAEDAASINKGSWPSSYAAIADLSDIPDLDFVRPKNPVYFGEYKKVGVSAKDERDPMGTFFWHRGLQAIVSDDGPIGKIAVTFIDNPPRAKAAVAQAIRDDETFGYRDIYSLIGDNQKIDEFAERYVENVMTYFQNFDGTINHKLRDKFVEPFVREDGTKGFTIEWTVSDEKGMDRLRVTHDTLSRMNDRNKPQYVLGREVKPIPYPQSDKAFFHPDRMWDWMGAQYARVAKEPIFLANYVGNRDQLLPLQQSLAQKFAEAGGRTTPSDADIKLATMAVDKQAQDAAYSFTLAYTDNPRNRSMLAYKVRNVARYYRATEDFYRRAARIARNYPDSYYRMALTYQALDDTGFTYRDENGDLYFAYPMNGLLQDAMATVLSFGKGGFQFGTAVDPFTIGGKVKGLSPSTDPTQWFPTLAGPVGVIPATLFIQRFPALQGIKTAVLGQYSEAGQTGSPSGELWDAVLPAGVARTLALLDESELDATILNSSAGALSIMVANGMVDWDPSDPATSARMESSDIWLEADKIGTALAITKVIMGWTVPAAPQVYQNNVSSFARDAGISGMKPLFRGLLDRNDGDFAAAMTDFVRLEHENGADNYLPFTISTYETPVNSLAGINSIVATKELADWGASDQGKRLLEEYPDAYLYLAPRGGEFDYAGWSYLTATGYKQRKNEHTIVRDILAAKAGREYMTTKTSFDDAMAGYDKTTEEGRAAISELEAGKKITLDEMVAANPFLREQRGELGARFSPTAIEAVRVQAYNMVTDEIARGSKDPAVLGIAAALETVTAYAMAKDGYSAYSNDGKAARGALDMAESEELAALGAMDPRVQEFIDDILVRE